MSNYLSEFIDFVYTSYETIEEYHRKNFQIYFSQASNVKRILDANNREKRLAFFKKIGVQIRDIENLDKNDINIFLKDCLFEINESNIRLLGDMYKQKDEYLYSCLMDDKNVLNYFEKERERKSFELLAKIILREKKEYIHEKANFLLFIVYTPSIPESLKLQIAENIKEETIDYTDVYSFPEPFKEKRRKFLNIQSITDDFICEKLILCNKLKKTWNNLIFIYGQLDDGNVNLIRYINDVVKEDYPSLYNEKQIHEELRNDAEFFLIYVFENEKIDKNVLDFFILQNKDFSAPSVLKKCFVDNEEYEIEKKNKEWNLDKCFIILKCFFDEPFRMNIGYSKLVCYLMKNDLERKLKILVNSRMKNFRAIDQSRLICIYACLLYNSFDIKDRKSLFSKEEIQFVLNTITLSGIDAVFSEWEDCLDKDEVDKLVNSVLLDEKIIFEKFLSNRITTIVFLEELIGIADPLWLEKALSYMDSCNFFDREDSRDDENQKIQSRFNQYSERLYKYIYSSTENEKNDQRIIEKFINIFSKIRDELNNMNNKKEDFDQKRMEKIKLRLRQLRDEYSYKREYITTRTQKNMDKLFNILNNLEDNVIQKNRYSKDILKYQKEGNSIGVQECKNKIENLMWYYSLYFNDLSKCLYDIKNTLNANYKTSL